MAWGIAELTLANINAMAARFGSLLRLHNRDGSIADEALSANIPRYSDTGFIDFVPVTTTAGGTGGTWAGAVITAKYRVYGNSMTVLFNIAPSTTSAAPSQLLIEIPAGWLAADPNSNAFPYLDNATSGTGRLFVQAGDNQIRMRIDYLGAVNWQTATTTRVAGQITFTVRRP